jgi:cytochrome P450
MAMNEMAQQFDPTSPDFDRDFYPNIQRMREQCRAYRHEGTLIPAVSVFRHADVVPMLQDWENWSSGRSEIMKKRGFGIASIMVGDDPPDHTRYRKLMAPFFMPVTVNSFDDIIAREIDAAMDKCLNAGEIDLVEDFAGPIVNGLICKICGIPDEDREFIRSKAMLVAAHYGKGLFWKEPNPDIEATIAKVGWEFGFYFIQHVEVLRKSKTPSILANLSEQLAEPREIAAICALLIAAGLETTTNMIVHGMQELIRHPDQFAMLRSDYGLMNGAIEEMFRYRGTLRRHERVAVHDSTIDDVKIAAGDSVILWNASANRDPAVFDRPEEFLIGRAPNRHIAFGSGIHTCLGMVMARAEMRLTFQRLLDATTLIEETRGDGSYESYGNGVMDVARRYSVKLTG